mmetsp:Transcript_64711/g.171313  ORF Transcript_64711/g.171313 Transcript_64711/m.171313 type:complete len:101 (-) Transcript_64711:467-769(-)
MLPPKLKMTQNVMPEQSPKLVLKLTVKLKLKSKPKLQLHEKQEQQLEMKFEQMSKLALTLQPKIHLQIRFLPLRVRRASVGFAGLQATSPSSSRAHVADP